MMITNWRDKRTERYWERTVNLFYLKWVELQMQCKRTPGLQNLDFEVNDTCSFSSDR